MEVSRGVNLVGMSMMPLDVCSLSLLIKKRIKVLTFVAFYYSCSLLSAIYFHVLLLLHNLYVYDEHE